MVMAAHDAHSSIGPVQARRIHVVPHPDGWATRFAGAPRISQTFRRRRDALAWAQGYAEAHDAEVTVHRAVDIAPPVVRRALALAHHALQRTRQTLRS